MKKILTLMAAIIFVFAAQRSLAQPEIYSTSGGEMLFQFSEVNSLPTNMRWTVFLHLGNYTHVDFNNNVGAYTGLALRNVGFIADDGPEKLIVRTYNLGVPLAVKVGMFDKQLYVFGGGEYEWLFHYKEKSWPSGNGDRDGEKTKYTEWFSSRVNALMPSIFFGVELPRGLNVKYKMYLGNYMNENNTTNIGSRSLDAHLSYLSLSWNIPHSSFKTTD
ncbi:MAG: hypothetical protein ABFS32_05865 [Bacteroidota bacterium]